MLAAVVSQVQRVLEDPFSFSPMKFFPFYSRYSPRSGQRVHPSAPQVWASGTRLGVSRLLCLNATFLANLIPDVALAESMITTASKTFLS